MLLLVIAGAAACLLLLACTNLASLVIARATSRVRELAVRSAMGAGRSRLVRQLLTESVLLATVGGGLGLVMAAAAVPTAARLVPTTLPVSEVPGLDLRMLAIAAIATLGTGIGFGVLPALRATRQGSGNSLRDGARVGSSRRTERLRATLVVAQVTVSIVLMVGAGLMLRTLLKVQATPTGFNPERVLTMRTTLPWSKYAVQAPRVEFVQRVLAGVTALPGVTTAAYTSFLPMTMRGGVWGVVVPGRTASRNDSASSRFVTPDYFRVMEIPMKRGRTFAESDSLKSQQVAIVSESFVSRYLDGQDAIGRTFKFSFAGERTIVGVVGSIRVRGLERPSEPQVYLPYQQQPDNQTLNYMPKDLVVKVQPGVEESPKWDALVASIRRVVAGVDPQQPVADVQPLSAIVLGETAARSVQLRVLGAFAFVSCLLAAVGLHGLLAFVVSARTREFGVRLALGAEPRQILSLVAGRGVMLGLAGVTAGVAIAYAAGRWIESLLVGVSPADPLTLAAAVVVSLGMTLMGSLLPALRASRTNPTAAIQVE
jgi:putative ABC transport system permease protein